MNKAGLLTESLHKYSARKLDSSRRGSGLNAVWKIQLADQPVVLKTFSSRRSPVKTILSTTGHALSGRTSYTARARQRTEKQNLLLWKKAGFNVPALIPCALRLGIPIPHLCMEFIDGVLMSDYLAAERIPMADRERTFIRFLKAWGTRHAMAERTANPRLLHEHGTFDHVLVSGDRVVTFDLEVSFRRKARVRYHIAEEICAYLRSLLKKQPQALMQRWLELLVREYPNRPYLEMVRQQLLENPCLSIDLVNRLDRRFFRKRTDLHKYNIAEIVENALRRF